MKAISIGQPWAQLLMLGAASWNIRSWKTSQRGIVLIHAAQRLTDAARAQWALPHHRAVLAQSGASLNMLPRGVLLGTMVLTDCVLVDELMFNNPVAMDPACGPGRPGAWAWKLTEPCQLPAPIPWRGALGLFEVPAGALTGQL